MALTSAMEDYLEAILMVKQQHGYVRCVDVAEQLGVKKPSVSRAVKEDLRKAPVFYKTAYIGWRGSQNRRAGCLRY